MPEQLTRQDEHREPQSLIAQVALLRAEGLDWRAIPKKLGVDKGELAALRWQRAAELHLLNWSWPAIAADPAVGYKSAYLRNKHKQASLPCGLSFGEYVASYRAGLSERSAELARNEGMRDAELMHQATRLLLEETHASIEALRDHRLNWREHMLTELMLAGLADMKDSGEGGQDSMFGAQSMLEFSIPETTQAPPPSYNAKLINNQNSAARTLRTVQQVLGNNPQAGPEDEPEADIRSQADVEILRGKTAALMSELESYSQPEAAHA